MKADKVASADAPEPNPLWLLQGIAKDIYKKMGEWEDIVKREREQFSDLHDRFDEPCICPPFGRDTDLF